MLASSRASQKESEPSKTARYVSIQLDQAMRENGMHLIKEAFIKGTRALTEIAKTLPNIHNTRKTGKGFVHGNRKADCVLWGICLDIIRT